MRIAVVHNLPPGGMKRAMREQVKRLSKKHRLDIFTLEKTSYRYPQHFPKSVISIYKDLPKVYKALADEINRSKYDVALVYPCFLTQAPFILKYLRIPSLYFCPEPKREFYEKIKRVTNFWTYWISYPFRIPLKYIDKMNAKKATKILTMSKYSKRIIEGAYGVEIEINYLGVDTEVFKPLITSKENMVLSVGELSLHKGDDFIIKSIAAIPKELRPKLVLIGHGGIEKEYLFRLAKEKEVDLRIIENVSDNELIGWYNRAAVFVYAAHNEPFGIVLLEAVSCGLPIVAVGEGGIREIVKESFMGDLVERSEKSMADVIQKYLDREEKGDKENRHEYMKNNWNWEKSVAVLEKHLYDIV